MTDRAEPGRMDLVRLAHILWHTNGCTRVAKHPGGVHLFRAAPSAGALYPTEIYVALRDVPGIARGIWNYQVADHSLALARNGDELAELASAAFAHPAVAAAQATVILTGDWRRSSWRYRERAYRRALLDTGHVLGNLVATAPTEGFTAVPITSFRDSVVERLLAVEPQAEGVLAVVPLVEEALAATLPPVPQRRSRTTEWHAAVAGVAKKVPDESPERWIAALHWATRLHGDAGLVRPPAATVTAAAGVDEVVHADAHGTEWDLDEPITATIAARRSTRAFAPVPIRRDELFRVLAHSYPDAERALAAPEILRTYVVALDVRGVPSGTYLYETTPRQLVRIAEGKFSDELFHLGLGQEIFVNAAAAIVHTTDLARAIERYGDRAYRLLGLDAGQLGERLNLAAIREGIGASGVGGYLDDEMNRVLRLPESQAVVYITVLGTPAD